MNFRSYIYGLRFFKGHERSVKLKINIFYSFLIKGASILVNLVLVPVTINYINPFKYGLWITLSSIIAWFSFFDIGLGQGLRNRFAAEKALNNPLKAKIYVSTTYFLLSIILGSLILIFVISNQFISWSKILNAPVSMDNELQSLAMIVFTFFCIRLIAKLILTILIADQRPARAAFLNLISNCIALCIVLILTKFSHESLIGLGLTISCSPILVLIIASFWYYAQDYKEFKPARKFIDLAYAKDIINLGIKFFIVQVSAIAIYQTSNIIISHVSGPEQVTPYNIAFKYFGVITMIFGIIISPFWSAITDAFTINDYGWIRRSINKLRRVGLLLTIVVLIMLIISDLVYSFWIGDKVSISRSVSLVLAIYTVINIWNSIHSNFLNGVGKIYLQLILSLSAAIINVPLAIYLGKLYGTIGVVSATIVVSLCAAIILPIQYNKIIHKKASGIWIK